MIYIRVLFDVEEIVVCTEVTILMIKINDDDDNDSDVNDSDDNDDFERSLIMGNDKMLASMRITP
jgi:hypothetical protein